MEGGCRSSAYNHTLKWENVTSHDSWVIFSLTEVSRWSDFNTDHIQHFWQRNCCTYPLGYIFFLSSVKPLAQPCIKLQPPLAPLLFYTIIAVFMFSSDLVTTSILSHLSSYFVHCFLMIPIVFSSKNFKMSNPPGIQEITVDPITFPIKEIANKSNSAGPRQNEKTFMKPYHKMSIKYGTMAPHKYWHKSSALW